MAKEADHIALANKNHDVLLHLLASVDRFPEWVTVAAFYKAVQIVEAVFVHNHGRSCHGHQKRLDALKARGYKLMHRHYRVLWAASSVARYLYNTAQESEYTSFTDYLLPERVKKAIVKRRLYGLECEAVRLLSDVAKAELLRIPDDL